MNHQKSELYFLFFLLAVAFVFSFFIFKPFLYALILATVFATVFAPVQKKLLTVTAGSKGLAAFLTTLLVFVIVLTPLTYLVTEIFREATHLYATLASNGGVNFLSTFVTNKLDSLEKFIPIPTDFSFSADTYLKSGLDWLTQNLGFLFSNAVAILGGSIIFLVALYYLLKNGKELKDSLATLSPLHEVYNEQIFSKLGSAVNSVVKGSLLIAIIQGVFAAIGFMIFGIPNAALWGSVAAVAALVPGIGTSLVIIPMIVYLFFVGNMFNTIGFAIWGIAAVSLIDNVLKPKLMQRGLRIHPFLILLSALGGILFFGPIGFLLGPLVLCLLFVLLEIYSSLQKESSS